MSTIDAAVVAFLNQFAGRSWAFDTLMVLAATDSLLKGGLIVAVLWALWFSAPGRGDAPGRQQALVAGLIGVGAALLLARGLIALLPYRPRPLHTPALAFAVPTGFSPLFLSGESSFPSDHAALYLGLAAVALLVSRRWGLLALGYVLVAVCLPRLYLGLHYPSDLLVGALLGAAAVLLAHRLLARHPLTSWLVTWADRCPRGFYSLFFILSFELATTFDGSRAVARLLLGLAMALWARVGA